MEKNSMILAKDVSYSLDCHKTQLNNNVLVVGTSGAGKTRSIVIPNILQATGSYVVSDPKGNLYKKYATYLRSKGYRVKKLDFTSPMDSARYNFFNYISDTQDINKIAHMMVNCSGKSFKGDPFWDDAAELLLQSMISILLEGQEKNKQNLGSIQDFLEKFTMSGDLEISDTYFDKVMKTWEQIHPDSYAVKQYKKFRVAASRTLRSIVITLSSKLGIYDSPEIRRLTESDDIDIKKIGCVPTAIFVVVSDTDRSLDGLVNLFFTQAMNELCKFADKECENNRLKVPVRFILDDFATNCKIAEFPRMISSIRSRGISTMLMIQAESQLYEGYGNDGRTIIGNCDTYIYLGGNDLETAENIARRCDLPLKRILSMPVGTNWIFRRGQSPINGRNFELEQLLMEIKQSTAEKRRRRMKSA